MKPFVAGALCTAVLLLPMATSLSADTEEERMMPVPSVVEFSLPKLTDGEFTLSDYRGKKVLAIFWASW